MKAVDLFEGLKACLKTANKTHSAIFEAERRMNVAGAKRAAEEAALLDYAERTVSLLDAEDFFLRWKASGAYGGNEHQIIIGAEGHPVEKRTNIPYFHENWSQYLDRIKLHNEFYPETAIRVKGIQNQTRQFGTPFGDVMLPGVYLVTEQPFVFWEREATKEEISDFLKSKGFFKYEIRPGERDADTWYNPNCGVFLSDAHERNIVMTTSSGKLKPTVPDLPLRIATRNDKEIITQIQASVFKNRSSGEIRSEEVGTIPAVFADNFLQFPPDSFDAPAFVSSLQKIAKCSREGREDLLETIQSHSLTPEIQRIEMLSKSSAFFAGAPLR